MYIKLYEYFIIRVFFNNFKLSIPSFANKLIHPWFNLPYITFYFNNGLSLQKKILKYLKKCQKRGMGPTCQKHLTSQQRLTANLAYPSVCGTRRRRHIWPHRRSPRPPMTHKPAVQRPAWSVSPLLITVASSVCCVLARNSSKHILVGSLPDTL